MTGPAKPSKYLIINIDKRPIHPITFRVVRVEVKEFFRRSRIEIMQIYKPADDGRAAPVHAQDTDHFFLACIAHCYDFACSLSCASGSPSWLPLKVVNHARLPLHKHQPVLQVLLELLIVLQPPKGCPRENQKFRSLSTKGL